MGSDFNFFNRVAQYISAVIVVGIFNFRSIGSQNTAFGDSSICL